MDPENLFATPTTYRFMRAEYLVGLGLALVLLAIHLNDVRILPAVLLFAYSDAIGYIPGAIAYRRSADKRISKAYYVAYNVGHSVLTAAVVAGLWALLVKPEWALLVIPVHLCGDRAIFGNFTKPFSVHFEPKAHPVYARVRDQLSRPAWEFEGSAAQPAANGDGAGAVVTDEAAAAAAPRA